MQGLIDIENPNRVTQKTKKVSQIELDEPRQLSRRERCVNAIRSTVAPIFFSHKLMSIKKIIDNLRAVTKF